MVVLTPGDCGRPPLALGRIPEDGRHHSRRWQSVSARRGSDGRTRHQLGWFQQASDGQAGRSEEHTSELQSHLNLVCRLLLEKKKKGLDRDEYIAHMPV